LIYLRAASEQRLIALFEEQGLDCREGLGARLWEELSRHSGTSVPKDADEQMLLDLLGQARPAGRTTTVMLLEITDPQVLLMCPVIEEAVAEESGKLAATSNAVLEEALEQLMDRLGREHPRYADAQTLYFRLHRNMYETQLYGASAERRVERTEIVYGLNNFALTVLSSSFFDLCRSIASRSRLIQLARSATARTLLDLVTPLSQKGIYFKFFTPEAPSEDVAWEKDLIHLEWSEDSMKALLRQRMAYVGLEGLRSLCHPVARGVEDFDSALVTLASGSPGKLVALGNELLAHVGTRAASEGLTDADLVHLRQYAQTLER